MYWIHYSALAMSFHSVCTITFLGQNQLVQYFGWQNSILIGKKQVRYASAQICPNVVPSSLQDYSWSRTDSPDPLYTLISVYHMDQPSQLASILLNIIGSLCRTCTLSAWKRNIQILLRQMAQSNESTLFLLDHIDIRSNFDRAFVKCKDHR